MKNLARPKRDARPTGEGRVTLYVVHSSANPDAHARDCAYEMEEYDVIISAVHVVVLYREP